MGQFSWFTQDTDKQIGSEKQNTITVYMFDCVGNVWKEDNYEGYGEFGGKDYYDVVAEMNGYTVNDIEEHGGVFQELRSIGIKLAFGDLKPKHPYDGPVLFPGLVENESSISLNHDFTQQPKNDPNQSWYTWEEDDDEGEYYDWDEYIRDAMDNNNE